MREIVGKDDLKNVILASDQGPIMAFSGARAFAHSINAQMVGMFLAPAVGLLLWLTLSGIDVAPRITISVVAFLIICWITEAIDLAVTALIGCYLFWALGVTRFSVAFGGFASTTPWFIFGGLLMSEAVTGTGLATRSGYWLLGIIGSSYSRFVLGIATLSCLITFVLPVGAARLTIIGSIVVGVVAALKNDANGNFAKGAFLVLAITCNLFDKMILAGASSILTYGIIKEQTGIEILWSQWFIAFLPMTVISVFACWLTVIWLYPVKIADSLGAQEYLEQSLKRLGPLSGGERKLLITLGVAISLWATDSLHHLEPTVIGLGLGLFLVLPKIGVLDAKVIKTLNFPLIIFVAGAISMANVLAETKVLNVFDGFLFDHVSPLLSSPDIGAVTLYWSGILYHFIFPNNQSLLSTSLPPLLEVVTKLGADPISFALIWQFAAGGTLFAYQSPVLLLGQSYGHFNSWDLLKAGALLMIIEGALLMFFVPHYWPLIGLDWTR
jgi:anion transporter